MQRLGQTVVRGAAVWLAALGALPASADVLIDDFSQGTGFTGSSGPGYFTHEDVGLDPQHTVGGARTVAVQGCIYVPTLLPVVHDPAAGTVAVGGLDNSRWCEGVSFEYGWRRDGNNGELDLDVLQAGLTHLEIDLLRYDRGSSINPPFGDALLGFETVYTRTTSSGFSYETTDYAWMDFVLPETETPQTVRVPLSDDLFTAAGEYTPTDVDLIYLSTGGAQTGAELIVSAIRLVGAGAAAAGDYDASGLVEQGDLDLVLGNWGQDGTTPPAGWASDHPEGLIDQGELDRVLSHWGAVGAPNLREQNLPEPVSAAVCLCGVLIRGRSRRNA